MNIIFFGSSDFSISILDALIASEDKVVKVVTTPDKPKGRGQKLAPTIVKEHAERKGIPVISPDKLKEVVSELESLAPDFLVVASYGKLVPDSVLKLPKIVSLNVHPSLIPKYRGASPIQSAILAGDKKTGMTIMEVIKALDAGDVFAQEEIKIEKDENASELSSKLAALGAKMVLNVIEQFKVGKVTRKKQDETHATYANKLERDSESLNWRQRAESIHNQVRAYYPWPAVSTTFKGKRLKILRTKLSSATSNSSQAGFLVVDPSKKLIQVHTEDKFLELVTVQPEGKKEMSAFDFANGQRIKSGEKFE